MPFLDSYPVIVTPKLADCRDFYRRWLGAEEDHDRITRLGAPIACPLRTEPWGQARFALEDPAGMWIDIVQQVEPEPGFWDPYLPA